MRPWPFLETMFNRALSLSYSKRKFFFVFPSLVLCGLVVVLFRVLSHGAGQWIQLSLLFLPVFLSVGVLLALGLILSRVYYHEKKGREFSIVGLIRDAKELLHEVAYLSLPVIFSSLVLWIFLGVFYLLRSIPQVGAAVSSLLSFGPFLLILGTLFLGALSFLALFYLTPIVAFGSKLNRLMGKELIENIGVSPFVSILLPLIALFPTLVGVGLLSLAAALTQVLYVDTGSPLMIGIKWLVMMVPFCAVLSPCVIFFFNFSCESFALFRKMVKSR